MSIEVGWMMPDWEPEDEELWAWLDAVDGWFGDDATVDEDDEEATLWDPMLGYELDGDEDEGEDEEDEEE